MGQNRKIRKGRHPVKNKLIVKPRVDLALFKSEIEADIKAEDTLLPKEIAILLFLAAFAILRSFL